MCYGLEMRWCAPRSAVPSSVRRLACVAIVCAVIVPVQTVAASCYEFNLGAAFSEARAVFVGRVVSIKPIRTTGNPVETNTVATLSVERQWKPPRVKMIDVSTCGYDDEAVCIVGVDFRVGDRYLVFAYGDRLDTTNCDTWRLSGRDGEPERRQSERQLRLLESRHRSLR